MFDFDASKLLIIGVVALIVIGPKDLPRVLRQVGQMVSKVRRMASEFQGQFMDAMKEADLADLKTEVGKLKDASKLDVVFNPVRDVRETITQAVGSASAARDAAPPAAAEPLAADLAAAPLPGPTPSGEPILHGAVSALDPDPVFLEPVEPAHHTPATAAGAVHAVDAGGPGRRRILVPKRRAPGDRLGRPAPAGRGRPFLPPRRDPRL